jgi:high-affinity iron transporter
VQLIPSSRLTSAVVLILLVGAISLPATADEPSPRAVVHLLDYIAQDYSGAVANGKVVSAEEFAEMREFSQAAQRYAAELPQLSSDVQIAAQFRRLGELIEQHADATVVAQQAQAIKKQIVARTHLATAPAKWPNLAGGRALYQQACAACHGTAGRGDGPVAATLNPPPSDFHDQARMSTVAPFHAFNTIRLGLQGTAMPSFSSLSEDESWALAFYVVSLRYAESGVRPSPSTPIAVEIAASESDEQIRKRLTGSEEARRRTLAAIRLHSDMESGDTLSTAVALLGEADAQYRAGNQVAAREKALSAYLDGIEPAEARIRTQSPELVRHLERDMAAVRSAIEKRQPVSEVSDSVRKATETIHDVQKSLQARPSSPWLVFSIALLIVLREGFEAVLIIAAILSVLRAVGARHAAHWVHAGWAAALAVGVAAWFLSGWLIGWSGLKRELVEAVSSLFAVVVLLYMGFWLHRRTQIAKWKSFVEEQVTSALGSRNRFGLAAISFLAVFREALETVLFLLALSLEGGPEARTFMAAGVATSLGCTFLLAWMLIRFSARLPLKTIFSTTALLMIVLSIVLVGKGLRALQEVGALSVTSVPFDLRVDLLGVFPTVETLAAQALIAAVSAILWFRARPS